MFQIMTSIQMIYYVTFGKISIAMRKLVITGYCLLISSCLMSQQFGGNPPSLKWKQINTDSVRIIFPAGLDSQANRAASIVHYLAADKLSIIVQQPYIVFTCCCISKLQLYAVVGNRIGIYIRQGRSPDNFYFHHLTIYFHIKISNCFNTVVVFTGRKFFIKHLAIHLRHQ